MSFGGNSTKALPAPKQKPLGLDENRAATNEQARPMPYLAGKTRAGVTWLCEPFEVTATAVRQQAGKGKSTTVGYNYNASMAALICHGPADVIEKIYLNGDEVWSGSMTRTKRVTDSPTTSTEGYDYRNIDIEGFGNVRIYWGTQEQGANALLQLSGNHPPYTGQCYMVFDQLFFGFNQTSAPNVEVVIGRYPVVPGMESLAAAIGDDCNPIAIIGDWLTNKTFGLGWDSSRLDTASLLTTAGQLASEGIGLSPLITKQSSARQMLAEICEYFGGYPILTPEGKFKIGLIRPPADVNALPVIDENVLVEEPELDPDSWSSIRTKTWIKFTDRTRGYKENALAYRDAGTANLITDNTPQTLERAWITVPSLAQRIVAAEGRAAALPATRGQIKVRRSVTLKPGDLFRLSYSQLGISNLVMRVTARSPGEPGARTIGLDVALDRSYLSESYFVPSEDAAPPPVDTNVYPFTFSKLIELPRGLVDDGKLTIAPVAVRPTRVTTGYNIHLRRNYTVAASNNYRAGYTSGYYSGNYTLHSTGFIRVDGNINPVLLDESYKIWLIYPAGNEAALKAAADAFKLIVHIGVINIRSSYAEQAVVIGWESGGDYTRPGYSGYKYAKVALLRGRQGTMMVNLSAYNPYGTYCNYYIHQQSLVTFSYDQIDTHDGFAKRGLVTTAYPAETQLIDQKIGLQFSLDTVYEIPSSPSLNNALQNELLIFIGNEIMSVTEISTSGSNYRAKVIRGRYDTRAEAHAVGEDLFLIPSKSLKKLKHASFIQSARCNLKLQPTVVRRSLELASVKEQSITLTGRINEPMPPVNLRAFGEYRKPTYATGQAIVLTWGLGEQGLRDLWSRWSNPGGGQTATILEFFQLDGTLKRTVITAPGATAFTYLYTAVSGPSLLGDFTTASDLKVRATAFENGLKSRFYEELSIKFI